MNKRGQISVEYIMIISIAMLILLPGAYLMRNYVFESSDALLTNRLGEISNELLAKSRKMYYYGPPSKSTIIVEMPDQISSMYILSVPDNDEYYLAFNIITSRGEDEIYYDSEVALNASEVVNCNFACQEGAQCDCFPERYYSEGIKNFRVEAIEDNGKYYVSIAEISPEMIE